MVLMTGMDMLVEVCIRIRMANGMKRIGFGKFIKMSDLCLFHGAIWGGVGLCF